MTLWRCAFEDFLTRSVGSDKSNLVDDYLKRRGWRKGARAKAYMKGLRTSVTSLYEVSEVVPGRSLLARDLIRGCEPIQITEGTATKMLKQCDRIAARIVPAGDAHILAGGILPFSPDASTMLLDGLGKVTKKGRSRAKLLLDDEKLRGAAPLFTSAWLFDVLPKAMGDRQPVLHNSDGEEVFHEVRFPLAVGVTQNDVAIRLDAERVFRPENAHFWNWLGDRPTKRPLAGGAPNAVAWSVTMENGAPVLGNVELKGRFLTLSVNSVSRAARGRALLENALGELARAPLTEIQTVKQMRHPDRSKKTHLGSAAGNRRARCFTICSINNIARPSTSRLECSATSRRAPPSGRRRGRKRSLPGSNTWRTDQPASAIPRTRWRLTTSGGFGANSGSKI